MPKPLRHPNTIFDKLKTGDAMVCMVGPEQTIMYWSCKPSVEFEKRVIHDMRRLGIVVAATGSAGVGYMLSPEYRDCRNYDEAESRALTATLDD